MASTSDARERRRHAPRHRAESAPELVRLPMLAVGLRMALRRIAHVIASW
ncbi:MAG: hypothetical protein M3237_09845 [Actinomycetota bacterium]|nr:hypothetical protein [Actinomycetota bacterium]